jgi:hypothetical protein
MKHYLIIAENSTKMFDSAGIITKMPLLKMVAEQNGLKLTSFRHMRIANRIVKQSILNN